MINIIDKGLFIIYDLGRYVQKIYRGVGEGESIFQPKSECGILNFLVKCKGRVNIYIQICQNIINYWNKVKHDNVITGG